MNFSLVGVYFSNPEWINILKNLAWLGTTENICKVFMICLDNLIKVKNFDALNGFND
jgi:hypothetical protein